MTWLADSNLSAFAKAPRDLGCVPVAADRTEAVLDLIMTHSPAAEPLRTSLSRLSRAVGYMGFPCVTAFSAWLAYRNFPHLGVSKNAKSP